MKKIIILLILGIFLISFISAEQQSLGNGLKQNTCIQLLQTCDNCSYINITAVSDPNSIYILNGQYEMGTENNYNYNYTFCDTIELGTYIYTSCGDLDGKIVCNNVDFEITFNEENFFLLTDFCREY